MSTQKRALSPSSSGQPSQPKRPCCAAIDQEWNGSERNHVPSGCLTVEDVRRELRQELKHALRQELKHALSPWAEYFQSIGNALKDIKQQMPSKENDFQKQTKVVELGKSHATDLRRANAKSTPNNGVRNLKLHLQTKLSLPLFTRKKIEGEEGARVCVALLDANTGDVVTSGPESSIKLDVVVLEGDFNKDNQDNWAQEEFEKYITKERPGKGPLLTGDLVMTLKGGFGELGDLIFTDNSSWNRTKKFRIGLKVASGYCGNTRIQEAVTDTFRVKEHRGELYKKHYPPASDDEVWRLEMIAKEGKSLQKLSEAGIHKVEDFLLQLFTDSKKLKEILGKSITPTSWDILVHHAMTCKTNWRLYLYHLDGTRKHGAVFNRDSQLVGLIKDTVYFASHRLSAQEKDYGDTIVKKALDNWDDVRELNGEIPVQRNLAPPSCVAPVGPKLPLASAISNAEVLSPGHNGVIASALPVRSQYPNFGNAMEVSLDKSVRLPAHQHIPADRWNVMISSGGNGITPVGLPSNDIISEYTRQSQMMGSLSHMGHRATENVLPSEPPWASISSSQSCSTLSHPEGNHMLEEFESSDFSDMIREMLADNPPHDETFLKTTLGDNGSVRGKSKGVNGWLKIKAVLQWGFFYRRGVRIVPLEEMPNGVRA